MLWKKYLKWRNLIVFLVAANFLLRLHLLLIRPLSMFTDGIGRMLPDAYKILNGSLAFYTPPLYMFIQALWAALFSGWFLNFMWKATSFLAFIGILLLLPKIFQIFRLEKGEKVVVLSLFLFSTWSVLLSSAILLDMLLAFLTLALFVLVSKAVEKLSWKNLVFCALLTAAVLYTKQTGFFVMAGFGAFVLLKKISFKAKSYLLLSFFIGFLLFTPWLIKNQVVFGHALLDPGSDALVVEENRLIEFGKIDYWEEAVLSYHYFWEIPLKSKVGFSGLLGTLFNIYYYTALLATLILSGLIIFGVIKYGWRYKEYFALIFFLLFFSLIYWNFLTYYDYNDTGRYTFPFHIFLYFFAAKAVSSFRNHATKKMAYLFVILFCLVSLAASYGITYQIKKVDDQLIPVADFIADKEGFFVTNDMFTQTTLKFYTKKAVDRPVNKELDCSGEKVFESELYKVYLVGEEYRICREGVLSAKEVAVERQ